MTYLDVYIHCLDESNKTFVLQPLLYYTSSKHVGTLDNKSWMLLFDFSVGITELFLGTLTSPHSLMQFVLVSLISLMRLKEVEPPNV